MLAADTVSVTFRLQLVDQAFGKRVEWADHLEALAIAQPKLPVLHDAGKSWLLARAFSHRSHLSKMDISQAAEAAATPPPASVSRCEATASMIRRRVDEHKQRFPDYRLTKTKVELRGPAIRRARCS